MTSIAVAIPVGEPQIWLATAAATYMRTSRAILS